MRAELRTPDIISRFWSRVEKLGNESGCWIFTGADQGRGYGVFTPRKNIPVLAHRFSAIIAGMDVGPTDQVCHKCDVRCCVNPSHLFVGTHQDNVDDRNRKGRQMKGTRHPLSKLTEEKVRDIKFHLSVGGISHIQLAHDFGVSRQLIDGIANRTHWKHI